MASNALRPASVPPLSKSDLSALNAHRQHPERSFFNVILRTFDFSSGLTSVQVLSGLYSFIAAIIFAVSSRVF